MHFFLLLLIKTEKWQPTLSSCCWLSPYRSDPHHHYTFLKSLKAFLANVIQRYSKQSGLKEVTCLQSIKQSWSFSGLITKTNRWRLRIWDNNLLKQWVEINVFLIVFCMYGQIHQHSLWQWIFFFIKLPELCEMRVQNVSTRDMRNHLQIKLRRVAHFDFRDHLRRLFRLSSPALFPEQHS